jgi:hypothetical protein
MQHAQNDPAPMQALRLDHPRHQRINYSSSGGRAARVTVIVGIYAPVIALAAPNTKVDKRSNNELSSNSFIVQLIYVRNDTPVQ